MREDVVDAVESSFAQVVICKLATMETGIAKGIEQKKQQ